MIFVIIVLLKCQTNDRRIFKSLASHSEYWFTIRSYAFILLMLLTLLFKNRICHL